MTESIRQATSLGALREAAEIGFGDLEEGCYRHISDDELDTVIRVLGRQASERVRAAGR